MNHFFYHGPYLKSWNARMLREDDNNYGLFDKNAHLVLNKLVGSNVPENKEYRSRYSYKALMQSVSSFMKKPSSDRLITSGFRLAERYFAPRLTNKLVALRLDDPEFFSKAHLKRDTSAGLTSYGHSKYEAFIRGMDYAHQILDGKTPHPCLAGARTQNTQIVDPSTGRKLPKTRLVWMYPEEMTILEAVIARPLIEYYLGNSCAPMAFGKTSLQLSSNFLRSKNSNQYILATDQSKFDQHIRKSDIRRCFSAWRKMFNLDQVIDREGHTVREVFNVVERYFIFTPLVFPHPKRQQLTRDKNHGVPSGSYFTQMLDSFVNYALTAQIFDDLGIKYNPRDIYVLGDDMIAFIHSKTSVFSCAAQAAKYGFKIHTDEKSSFSSSNVSQFDFLGRHWLDQIPYRTIDEVVDKAQYPEHVRDYRNVSSPLDMASSVVYSYGLTAEISGANWDRGKLIRIPRADLSGFIRYISEEVGYFDKQASTVSAIY